MDLKFIKSSWYKMVMLVLAALFIHSCSFEFLPMDKPTNPYASFTIKGKVVDSHTNEPVQGILVTRYETYVNYQTQEVEMIESIGYPCMVNEDGEFYFDGKFKNDNYEYMYLGLEDHNYEFDGKYQSKMVLVKLHKEDQGPEIDPGFQGHYTAEITIELKPLDI